MKAVLINGSPRKGNTYAALEALKKGFANVEGLEMQEVMANDVAISPCIACEACSEGDKCVFDDDTNNVIDTIADADVVVFATPVYWWGVTAQLKLIIDKMYSQGDKLKACSKKAGIIVIGEADQDDPQYEIIPKQFACIFDHLGWDSAFSKTYTAGAADDLTGNTAALAEIEELWKTIR